MRLKAIGINSASIFEHELFSWRQIRSGKQLGALAGLPPRDPSNPCQENCPLVKSSLPLEEGILIVVGREL